MMLTNCDMCTLQSQLIDNLQDRLVSRSEIAVVLIDGCLRDIEFQVSRVKAWKFIAWAGWVLAILLLVGDVVGRGK